MGIVLRLDLAIQGHLRGLGPIMSEEREPYRTRVLPGHRDAAGFQGLPNMPGALEVGPGNDSVALVPEQDHSQRRQHLLLRLGRGRHDQRHSPCGRSRLAAYYTLAQQHQEQQATGQSP